MKCRPNSATPPLGKGFCGQKLKLRSFSLNAYSIAIGSSFTVEPLRIPLQHWFSFLGRNAELSLVPYGQMMLHLIDPNSPWQRNEKGFNILLFRPSDLIQNGSDLEQLQIAINEFCSKFENASRQWRAQTLVILVTPQSHSIAPEIWPALEASLMLRLKTTTQVDVIRDDHIFQSYRCESPQDTYTENAAHIPWNDTAWLSIATAITRYIDAKSRPPLKAIVVDCDNTLWHGVCGEDGPQGIRIEPRHQDLQNLLLQQRTQGRLICLCSKNSPDDVWNVFDTNPNMLLKREHITAAMINWSPKSNNLLQLTKNLSLAPDSFLFLDDNPLEIGEVRANLPEVISIALPTESPESWDHLLKHLWPFDGQSQTAEDLRRAQMYLDESQRSSLRAQTQSLPEFLKSLDIEVAIQPLEPADEARADQLLQRTNQFNIRPSLRSLAELHALSLDHELEILTVRTRDRFGDYGLVGLLIFHCEGTTLHLDHLVLSCRALGRTVEVRMLRHLAQLADQRLKQNLEIKFESTPRNQPAYNFLCDISHAPTAATPQSTRFVLAAETLLSIDPIAFTANQKNSDDLSVVTSRSTEIVPSSLRYQKIAELHTAESIETFHRSQYSKAIERVDGVELPSTKLERQICEMCQLVLYATDIGLSDSFRDLGCTSLQFVRICSRIKNEFGISIAVAETFALATVRDLVQLVETYLTRIPAPSNQNHDRHANIELNRESNNTASKIPPERNGHEIAIVGMAGRFPGANDVPTFWRNLLQGIESIETLSEDELNLPFDSPLRTNPNLVRRSSYIKDADQFDARFFGVFPKEAAAMDPQHRLLLEECYHALEDAGYIPDQVEDSVGVFAGCYMDTYVLSCLESHPEWIQGLANSFHGGDLLTELGNDKDYLATRISFLLNLRGPALTIQTACSTSLVAIIQACQSLQSEQCRMALAGGVTLKFPQKRGYLYTEGGMVSPEGKCRTFDAKAKGTIFGEGVAVVVLKRLEHALQDGDSIYAVLKGWGINNDGRSKAGYTAPSIAGQTEAIALAHQHARITADSIQYLEAHGTGTALGDPIEIEALTRAFRKTTDQKQYCRIGSAKTNIGHLDVAAGACGLIKASLSLQQEQIPPTLNFETPNPNIDFANSPFVVNTQCSPWPRTGQPRRAGLSSFGVGGTNAHVVIEEAPLQHSTLARRPYHILNLSARSDTALVKQKQQLLDWLTEHPTASISDVCYTLNVGRKKFNYSWTAVVSNCQDALQALSEPSSKSANSFTNRRNVPIVFAFPGQGSQHIDMGLELYQSEPVFAEAFDRCNDILQSYLQFNLRDALFASVPSPDTNQIPDINQTIVAQPGIFAISYATARWLQSLGLSPAAMIGHSVGEFVAACLSGIFTLEDALKIVAYRAQCMQQIETGHMLAVRLGEEALLQSASYKKYASRISLAAVNSPQLSVLSGEVDVIELLQKDLEAEGIISKVLKTSHAFHSWMMDSVVEPLAIQLRSITLHKPTIKIASSVTGTWLSDEEALSPDYWAKHLRETVRFSAAAETILAGDFPIILEVGPGQTVTTLIKQHKSSGTKSIQSLFPHVQQRVNAIQYVWQSVAKVWQAGADIRLGQLHHGEKRLRLNLPGYPFERQRFWFDQLVASQTSIEKQTPLSSSSIDPRIQNSIIDENDSATSPNNSHNEQYATYARNDEYSAIVQQVIRQQLEIMSQQLRVWHP